MQILVYFLSAFGLIAVAFIVFRVVVRRDYVRRQRLTALSSFLELLVWTLYMAFPYIYNPPQWALIWLPDVPVSATVRTLGLIGVFLGIATAFGTMIWFGLQRAFGLEVSRLIRTGPYRVTRNPQVVGGTLMVVGTAVIWPSWYALGWVLLYFVVAHLMVITEEEHLRDVFGEEYKEYCKRVPRYFGIARSR